MRANACLNQESEAYDGRGAAIASDVLSAATDLTILVVEDDDTCRAVVRGTLQHAGFEVMCASNVLEAMKFIESGADIDIAVIDVIMPPGTPHGASFAEVARARIPELRVIFMSASLRPGGYALYGEKEAFLCKPFAPDLLLEAVTRVSA